ncbi:MAG TPA: hypothetical protein VGX21_12660 [Methylomirabilota bacterium]|nr:hypothetical protein [Methylomirabilota bacterium]
MGKAIAIVLLLGWSLVVAVPGVWAQAATGRLAMTTEEPYVGGRGLITDTLTTGMFINPTSGILNNLQFTLQYCALIFHNPGPGKETIVGHGAIAGFGLLDWVEIGAAGLLVDTPGPDDNPKVGGPTVKVRLLKDRGGLPEIGVGGVFLFGDKAIEQNTVYVALSKGLRLSDGPFFRSVRGHIGFRQTWVEVGEDGSFGYVGGEVEVFRHTFVVAEVSNKSGGADKIPWAAGLQVRHPDGFGFTLAAVQTGGLANLAVYVGVGINFQ